MHVHPIPPSMAIRTRFSAFLLLLLPLEFIAVMGVTPPLPLPECRPILAVDRDLVQLTLNLEFLEAEFFLHGALGMGLDVFGPRRSSSSWWKEGQSGSHHPAITESVGGVPRPRLNISAEAFAAFFNRAMNTTLSPPFNPYANSLNYLLASYVIPYVGLVGYVGTIPNLVGRTNRELAASLLGVESGQDAVIRTLLYLRANEKVKPYGVTVAGFTDRISEIRNRLGRCGMKDEGLKVPKQLGAENRTTSNILSADADSLSYSRTQPEILRIVYGTGDESRPGGFLPNGGAGRIAMRFLAT
ncbi:hypothetical protein ES332_D11G131200v1 [Gossypium tomentosum]|uniref:Desiccation-related protein PCC13-62 n=1 Tax=Gossypium tomentosum TaxID=34277 RepID=A0A5D2IME4_GOSTO|nr:hypothetical protein ES332_D11G131200v1 [Gossypium tomentosum]